MTTVIPPTRLRFADAARTVLAADWRDGHASAFPLPYLRGWCPCALCQGHGSGSRFAAASASRVKGLNLVGAYAVSIQWEDGHSTGIYTWESLRALCPCVACGGPAAGTPPEVAALVAAAASIPESAT